MSEQLKESGCSCPYCDEEILSEASPLCKPCPVVLHYCANCRIAVASELQECPQCGQSVQ